MAGRVENLTPWKPGQSGNPNGRPRKKPLTDAYLELMDKLGKDCGITETDTVPQIIAKMIARNAMEGDVVSAREITNRTDGLPTVHAEVTGKDGGPIQLRSTQEFVKVIREIYGLDEPDTTVEEEVKTEILAAVRTSKRRSVHRQKSAAPAQAVPVPKEVGKGPEPAEVRKQEP